MHTSLATNLSLWNMAVKTPCLISTVELIRVLLPNRARGPETHKRLGGARTETEERTRSLPASEGFGAPWPHRAVGLGFCPLTSFPSSPPLGRGGPAWAHIPSAGGPLLVPNRQGGPCVSGVATRAKQLDVPGILGRLQLNNAFSGPLLVFPPTPPRPVPNIGKTYPEDVTAVPPGISTMAALVGAGARAPMPPFGWVFAEFLMILRLFQYTGPPFDVGFASLRRGFPCCHRVRTVLLCVPETLPPLVAHVSGTAVSSQSSFEIFSGGAHSQTSYFLCTVRVFLPGKNT